MITIDHLYRLNRPTAIVGLWAGHSLCTDLAKIFPFFCEKGTHAFWALAPTEPPSSETAQARYAFLSVALLLLIVTGIQPTLLKNRPQLEPELQERRLRCSL